MGFRIRGYNDWYEGWLARALGQPCPPGLSNIERDSLRLGWRTADESDHPLIVLLAEIRLGHIIVEKETVGLGTPQVQQTCATGHAFASNPGLYDTKHRYCTRCGVAE